MNAPAIIEYLKNPPDRATPERLLRQMGIRPRESLRSTLPEVRISESDRLAVETNPVQAVTCSLSLAGVCSVVALQSCAQTVDLIQEL
jgi:hypothetical protein